MDRNPKIGDHLLQNTSRTGDRACQIILLFDGLHDGDSHFLEGFQVLLLLSRPIAVENPADLVDDSFGETGQVTAAHVLGVVPQLVSCCQNVTHLLTQVGTTFVENELLETHTLFRVVRKEKRLDMRFPPCKNQKIPNQGADMNRRDALKKLAAAAGLIAVPAVATQPVWGKMGEWVSYEQDSLPPWVARSDSPENLRMKTRIISQDGVWDIYEGEKELGFSILLDQETLVPFKPTNLIYVKRRKAVRVKDGVVKELPPIIVENQRVLCYNMENPKEQKIITT